MVAINIDKKLPGKISTAISAGNTTAATLDDLTAIDCQGYNKLMIQYTVTSGWDRAGTIAIYHSLDSGGTYVAVDSTIDNSSYTVSTTATGGIFVVENHSPYIKVAWTRTTTGTTGTISVSVMPFNQKTLRKKWSGLGMGLFSSDVTADFDSYVDDCLANGFTNLRVDIPDYQDATWLARSKSAVTRAVAKGANITWGVSSNKYNSANYVITTENWTTGFRPAILDAATWAQANGVYEFQLGNEEEAHIDRNAVSLVRSGNVTTATFTEDHGFTAGNTVLIWGCTPSSFDLTWGTITVTGAKTFTYVNTGSNGSASNTGNIRNISENSLQTNLKAAVADVKAIFTNGNVSYTTSGDYYMGQWYSLGIGDIDLLAWNVYADQDSYQTTIDNMVSYWGANTYITEFNVHTGGLDAYSTNEVTQAAKVTEMINYIKVSGITRANYFYYISDNFGARKADGTYRKLWYTSLLNT